MNRLVIGLALSSIGNSLIFVIQLPVLKIVSTSIIGTVCIYKQYSLESFRIGKNFGLRPPENWNRAVLYVRSTLANYSLTPTN